MSGEFQLDKVSGQFPGKYVGLRHTFEKNETAFTLVPNHGLDCHIQQRMNHSIVQLRIVRCGSQVFDVNLRAANI